MKIALDHFLGRHGHAHKLSSKSHSYGSMKLRSQHVFFFKQCYRNFQINFSARKRVKNDTIFKNVCTFFGILCLNIINHIVM